MKKGIVNIRLTGKLAEKFQERYKYEHNREPLKTYVEFIERLLNDNEDYELGILDKEI